MKQILKSWIVNNNSYDIAKINCLPQYDYLIKYYYYLNFNNKKNMKYSLYNMGKNKISEDSIVEALTK